MPSAETWLFLDFIGLTLFITWSASFYPFILSRPPSEIDSEHQNELLFYAVSLSCLLVWGGLAQKYGRHKRLGLFLRDSWRFLEGQIILFWNAVLRFLRRILDSCPSFLSKPVKNLSRIFQLPNICYACNFVFDIIIFGCLMSLFAVIFIHLATGNEISLYMPHFALLFVYVYILKFFFSEYTANRLVMNFSYACLHMGILYDYLGYEDGYFGTHAGLTIFILDIIFHFLNTSDTDEMMSEPSSQPPGPVDDPEESGKPAKKRKTVNTERPTRSRRR